MYHSKSSPIANTKGVVENSQEDNCTSEALVKINTSESIVNVADHKIDSSKLTLPVRNVYEQLDQLDIKPPNDEWLTLVSNIHTDTLQLQRRLSAELKEDQVNCSTPTTFKLPISNFTNAPKITKCDTDQPVLELKEQLLKIQPKISENTTDIINHNREKIKLRIKANQTKQLRMKSLELQQDLQQGGEVTNTKPSFLPRMRKSPAPQPPQKTTPTTPHLHSIYPILTTPTSPTVQQNVSQPTTQVSKPFKQSAATSKQNPLGIQWKKMQNSKSFRFITDKTNFKGIRKAFKNNDDYINDTPIPKKRHSISGNASYYYRNRELSVISFVQDQNIEQPTKEDEVTENSAYISEIVDLLEELKKASFHEYESDSNESDSEENTISKTALKEIELFEKLISDYAQETSSGMPISEEEMS